jgi:hypothetical protein
MTDPTNSAEADAKVAIALAHIEEAQRDLDRACQALSPIVGGFARWKRISALHDRVRSEWYQLHGWAAKHRGRLDLDGIGRAALSKTGGRDG